MYARRIAGTAGVAVIIALLIGCGTPDPLDTEAGEGGGVNRDAGQSGGSDAGDGSTGTVEQGEGGQPVESNQVTLTWVEASGASSKEVFIPNDLGLDTFELRSTSGRSVAIAAVTLETDAPEGAFAIVADVCSGKVTAECEIKLQLDPIAAGSYSANLVVTYSDASQTVFPISYEAIDPNVPLDNGNTEDGGTDDGGTDDGETDEGGTDEGGTNEVGTGEPSAPGE